MGRRRSQKGGERLTASEPAPAVAATREEVEKVQIGRWDDANGDPSVAEER